MTKYDRDATMEKFIADKCAEIKKNIPEINVDDLIDSTESSLKETLKAKERALDFMKNFKIWNHICLK